MLVFTPQPHYHFQQSPRERYLRALAEENAAREAYAAQLAQDILNPCRNYSDCYAAPMYSSCGRQMPYVESPYERHLRMEYLREQQEARERELQRQQEIEAARRAAIQAHRDRIASQKERIAEARRREYERYAQEQERQQTQQRESMEQAFASIFGVPFARHSQQQPPHDPRAELRQKAAQKIQDFFRAAHARRPALMALQSIRRSLASLTSSFAFPDTLDFDSESSSPKLLYTSNNASIHAYEDSLMKLLSKLDSIESAGDKVVRRVRKELAREIENTLAQLDARKEEMWKRQQQTRAASTEVVEPSAMDVVESNTSSDQSTSLQCQEEAIEVDVVQAPVVVSGAEEHPTPIEQDSTAQEAESTPPTNEDLGQTAELPSSPVIHSVPLPASPQLSSSDSVDSNDIPIDDKEHLLPATTTLVGEHLTRTESPAFLNAFPPSAPSSSMLTPPILNDPQVIAPDEHETVPHSDGEEEEEEHDAVLVEKELQPAPESTNEDGKHIEVLPSAPSTLSESSISTDSNMEDGEEDQHDMEIVEKLSSHSESEDFEVV